MNSTQYKTWISIFSVTIRDVLFWLLRRNTTHIKGNHMSIYKIFVSFASHLYYKIIIYCSYYYLFWVISLKLLSLLFFLVGFMNNNENFWLIIILKIKTFWKILFSQPFWTSCRHWPEKCSNIFIRIFCELLILKNKIKTESTCPWLSKRCRRRPFRDACVSRTAQLYVYRRLRTLHEVVVIDAARVVNTRFWSRNIRNARDSCKMDK